MKRSTVEIEILIHRSSMGEPEAEKLRSKTPRHVVDRIVVSAATAQWRGLQPISRHTIPRKPKRARLQ
ncbi:MAG: hypothetical protein IT384_18860 [Deltaproteobacteria bacterium]|nr:hypothetical protein [Deltaproteobacteria bacterium]